MTSTVCAIINDSIGTASKAHSKFSLQMAFPSKGFEYPLPERLPRQAHCVQSSVLGQLPQQSSPSKKQSSLLVLSLHLPSSTNSPFGQSFLLKRKGKYEFK